MLSDLLKPANIFSIALGLAGVLWGVYTFYASKQYASVSYAKTTKSIFDDKSGHYVLSKKVNSEKVDALSLSITRFAFWNSGTLPINLADLRRPLQILASSNANILEVEITGSYPKHAEFTSALSDGKSVLGWRYFDPKFLFILDIYHSGAEADLLVDVSYISDLNIAHDIPFYSSLTSLSLISGIMLVSVVAGVVIWLMVARLFVPRVMRRFFPSSRLYATLPPPFFLIMFFGLVAYSLNIFFLSQEANFARQMLGFEIPRAALDALREVNPSIRVP